MLWPKKIHTRNLISKKNSCSSKIPQPSPHNFSNGPSLKPGACESAHTVIRPGEFMGYKPRATVNDIPKQRCQNIHSRPAKSNVIGRLTDCLIDCLVRLIVNLQYQDDFNFCSVIFLHSHFGFAGDFTYSFTATQTQTDPVSLFPHILISVHVNCCFPVSCFQVMVLGLT